MPSQGCTVSAEARHRDTWEQERVLWSSAVCKECVDGKVLGFMLVFLAVEA